MEVGPGGRIGGSPGAREGAGGFVATALVAAAIVLAFCTLLGSWALFDPDEGRNGLVALEMARSGPSVLPTLAGLPFLDKPFLYFAAVASSIRWLGRDELAVRLPSAIFALGVVAMTFARAWRELGAGPARIAALVCASIPLFLAFARIAILDSCLGFFVVGAILAFERSVEDFDRERPGRSRTWSTVAWASAAVGVLVKGPVALVVPLLVAAPYAGWRGRGRVIWWPGGPLVLAAILVPWLAAVEHRAPGFLRYALVTETFARVATDRLHRSEPFWYFVPIVVVAAFPWSWVVLAGVREAVARGRRSLEARRTLVFLALWLGVPLLFFSIVRSKRPQYIVPLLPALALQVAWLVKEQRERLVGAGAASVGWLVLAAACALFSLAPDDRILHLTQRFPAAIGFARAFAGVAGLSGLLAWALRRQPTRAVWALAVPVLLLPFLGRDLLAEVAETHSGRALVREIQPSLENDPEVVGIATYAASAAFYLGRPVLLSSYDGAQLTSNSIRQDYDELVGDPSGSLRRADYWQRALAGTEPRPIFVTGRRSGAVGATLRASGYRELDAGRYRAWVPRSARAEPARAGTSRDD